MSNVKTRNRGCLLGLVIASFFCLALAVTALSLQLLDILRGSPERTSTAIAYLTDVMLATARADATQLALATSAATPISVAVGPTPTNPPVATTVPGQMTPIQVTATPFPSATQTATATLTPTPFPTQPPQATSTATISSLAVIPTATTTATATNVAVIPTATLRFELEGFELRMTAAEWTAREGYVYLLVLGRLVNDNAQERCARASAMRLYLDGVEYRPNNGLMGRIQPTLGRDYLGAYGGQCVAANTSERTLIAFEIPRTWEQAELVFEGEAQAVTLPQQISATATSTPRPTTAAAWRFELEGFELRMTAAEWTAREGYVYLIVLGRLINDTDIGQCAYARSMRLFLDGVEYRPNNGLMGRVQTDLRRNYMGAYAGQCVPAHTSEATFAAFELPLAWEQAELAFEGQRQPVTLPVEISATATIPAGS